VISPGQSFHVGVPIFDTRYMIGKTQPPGAMTSYQFSNRETKPCIRAASTFDQAQQSYDHYLRSLPASPRLHKTENMS
jgi:hypothetical protein